MLSRLFMGAMIAATALFLVSCRTTAATIPLTIDGHVLQVEIAKTPAERELGLMNRRSMPRDHGMLFIFPTDQHLSFWMKNTLIPLAIAYISSDGTIKEIHHMTPLSLEAINSYYSVRYALEVNEGEFKRLGIKPGDRVVFPATLPVAIQ